VRPSVIELAAIAAVLLSLAQRTLWPGSATATWILLGLGGSLVLIVLAINPARWQMTPAALVVLALLAQAIGAAIGGELVNRPGVLVLAFAVALLALSVMFSWGMPAGRLPAPSGRYAVGVAASVLTRPGPSPDAARSLEIKVWYPATSEGKGLRFEPVWSDLRRLPEMPAVIRALLAYLGRIKTHSIIGATPDLRGGPHPLVIYNHSLVSFASENTLLMEQLASHGYVVISIRHRDQSAEYAAIQAGIPKPEQARDRELLAQLKTASSRDERARLSLEQFRNSTGMSAIVRSRAEDSLYVLNHMDRALAGVPGGSHDLASSERFGALGLSLGGAVATELCLLDQRCLATANLDGGLYGIDENRLLTRPYLMIYSQDNVGTNDAFKRTAVSFHEDVLANGKHLDLHDATVLFPGLKWFGLLGAGSGAAKNLHLQQIVTGFFDEALTP